MLIQKIEIKSPIEKSSPRIRRNLNHSNSICQFTSTLDSNNNIFNLPKLPNDSRIKNESIKLSHLSVYDLRNFSQNNNSESFFVKYKPKRLIKNKPGSNESPFQDFRYLPLNQDKVFKSLDKESSINTSQQLINFSSKKSDEFFDEDSLKLKKYAFRSIYMLKMEKNIQDFDKLKKYSNVITNNKIGIFDELTYKISKLMNSQKLFFFQNLYQINESSFDIHNEGNKLPNISQSSNLKASNITKFNINKNKNINLENMAKKEIMLTCDFNNLVNKIILFLLNEIKDSRNENFKLLQKNHEEEIIINSKTKSLKELNSYINRYDVNIKIDYVKKQQEKNKLLKKSYNIKENEYISQIYKLENELKIMTTLLKKNKKYFDICQKFADKINSNKKEKEEMKREFRSELREKNNLFMLEKNKENELNEQMDEMMKIIEDLKKEKIGIRKIDLIDKSIIKKLENKINEKNENIMMINEELECYIKKSDNLKKLLNDRESTIKTMEMKLNQEYNNDNNSNNNNNL